MPYLDTRDLGTPRVGGLVEYLEELGVDLFASEREASSVMRPIMERSEVSARLVCANARCSMP